MITQNQPLNRRMGAILLLLATLLYLFTLDNGLRPNELVGGDLITHQYAQVEGRPSNAPGYPLYVMGGWLWFRLGRIMLGEWLNSTQILSCYSTLWGVASLALLYTILLKVSHGRWPLAFLLTVFYGTTYFFWYYSVTTEQYSSAVFQTLLLVWLAFQWEEQPHHSTLLWMAFVCGTMLANMLTTLFMLPPLLWFIFSRPDCHDRKITFLEKPTLYSKILRPFVYALMRLFSYPPKLVLQGVGVTLLPLLSYAYIYIRGAQHPEWRGVGQWPTDWAWFVQFITIQQGRDELAPGLTWHHFFTAEFPSLMWQELTWPIFLGGLVGLIGLGQRRAIFLFGTLVIYAMFCWSYRFGNWFQVIIPAYPLIIIGFAAAVEYLGKFRLSYLLIILLIGYRFTVSFPRANQHDLPADTGLDPAWAILADKPITPAIIYGDFSERVAMEYLQTMEGVGTTLTLPITVPSQYPLGYKTEIKNQKFYVTRRALAEHPEIIQVGARYPQSAGEQLIALSTVPRQNSPIPQRLNLDFGQKLRLIGWEQVKNDYPLPDMVAQRLSLPKWQIALYWQAVQLDAAYTISVRPLLNGQMITRNGESLIQDHQPVWGFYPTAQWSFDEIVRDVYAIALPPKIKPTEVQIVVYQVTPSGFENVAVQTIKMR